MNEIENVYVKDVKLIRENKKKEAEEQNQVRKRSTSAVRRMFSKIKDDLKAKDYDPYDYAFEI